MNNCTYTVSLSNIHVVHDNVLSSDKTSCDSKKTNQIISTSLHSWLLSDNCLIDIDKQLGTCISCYPIRKSQGDSDKGSRSMFFKL